MLYGSLGIFTKVVVAAFVLTVPLSAYMAPDVLKIQADEIFDRVNALRLEKGEPLLGKVPPLEQSSQAKADDMAKEQYFSHTGSDGKSITSLMQRYAYDYEYAGENLAMGFNTPDDVVRAWEKSPTHYANLIDEDYVDAGIGMKSGEYEDIPTTYIAMHFGAPRTTAPKDKKSDVRTGMAENKKRGAPTTRTAPRAASTAQKKDATENVAGVSVAKTQESIAFDRAGSRVYWKADGDGTLISARASIAGPVRSAEISVGPHRIGLEKGEAGIYGGSLLIPDSPDELFHTIISPSLLIVDEAGNTVQESVEWNSIKIVSPPPLKKYVFAKSVEGPTGRLFSLTEWLYRGFIVFFGIALALCIFIEYKKQLPIVIAQTLVLIGLFSFLLWV